MMISPEKYREELKNLTLEELSERKEKLEKFINDYENNNLSEQEYLVKPYPKTKYELYKEYLDEVMIELGLRRHQSEWERVKVFESQCANCKNYLGDINCKIYDEIDFDILGNKKECSNRKDNVEGNNENYNAKDNKAITDIIDEKLQEFDDNTANNLRKYILEIMKKIIALPNDFETSISKIINYNPESNFVDPLTQEIIFNKVSEISKEISINLQLTYDGFGGLAFYYTFIKMEKNKMIESENSFKPLNKNIEKLTKKLAQAYDNNDQEQITKLQNEIKEVTNRQLQKNVNKLVKKDLKEKNYYINREILLNKLGYLYEHRDKRKNYLTEKDFILDELKIIKNELMSNEDFETIYIPCVRAQHCINEFIYYLEKKQVNDCLMDIYEIIESDKNGIYNPIINKDFNYSIYIGNEEKSIILNMVNRLEACVNDSSNKYSTENLFKKAKEEFNYFVENEYGVNKHLSLPLPLSYNKLKSLILLSSYSETEEIYKCGYVLIDTITGNVEYKLETEQLLSNNFQLNLLNFTPKIEIPINNKDDYNNLYDRYFKLLDDLILMYESKSEYIENKDKIKEFLNIYRNMASESEQIEYSLNNEFLSWCLISLPKQKIEKLNFEKQNVIIKETYIDENGHEQEREKSVQMTKFPPKEEKVDLISKIDAKLKDINPSYEPPIRDNIVKSSKNHNVKELIDKIDEEIRKINENIATDIFQKISNLPDGTEFNFQQFMNDYDIAEEDKKLISDLICDYCQDNDIIIVEKLHNTDIEPAWNIPRIKKNT